MLARPIRSIALGTAAALSLSALLMASMPVAPFKGAIERRLGEGYGRPVRIASLARVDRLSFAPRILATGIVIAQPSWAGSGTMARIDRLEMRLPLWPLLLGRIRPRDIAIAGLEADLVRRADGLENWRADGADDTRRGGPPPAITSLRDAHIRYRDLKRDRSFDIRATIDSAGLRIAGAGAVKGAAVRVVATGGPMKPGRWRFAARLDGTTLDFRAAGAMDAPLDLSRFDARIAARAANMSYIDAIIEAGLPATQPVRLSAEVRRDRPDWRITDLSGTIGRSDIRGAATIRRRDGRHLIDGAIAARRFDFDDLADARGRAIAAAKRSKFGKRLFPDTAIDLDNVRRTDGSLRLHVDRLLWPGPSPLRRLDATLRVDRQLLTVEDLRIGLTRGVLAGRISIDQRRGGPILTTDIRLRGARLADFVPGAGFDAPLSGRMRLEGPGRTVRAAIGRSTGRIALVAREGVLPEKTAALLGQELGGLLKSGGQQARLRCLAMRLDAKRGVAVANPIVIDTSRAVTRVEGEVALADERLSLRVQGVPKRGGSLRIAGAIPVSGTIKAPEISLPEGQGVVGTLLKSIGKAIDGKADPVAADQDCDGLAKRAMAD